MLFEKIYVTRKPAFIALMVLLVGTLFSCGQKGPLFLLEEMPEQTLVETESEVAAEQQGTQESENTLEEEKASQEKKKKPD